jgi:cold shock CspA family protein
VRTIDAHDLHTGVTERISVHSTGQEANGPSAFPTLSADGRIITFHSLASNLVPNDTNHSWDIFVHDRETAITERISMSSAGQQGNNGSYFPDLSADGRLVAFYSLANNLVPNDTNNNWDVFVYDRQSGVTARVSVGPGGGQANGSSTFPDLSADGRYVVFDSTASNLVSGDTNGDADIFVHDRQTGLTGRVSVSSTGQQTNGDSRYPVISADNSAVAFTSDASNLVSNDTNGSEDVFVYERETGQTERISVDSAGQESNGASHYAVISADGRLVSFDSDASNLVVGDTNNALDVFLHNRQTGVTLRVSVSSTGGQGNGSSTDAAISADGLIVAFHSDASNLVAADTNGVTDVFLHVRSLKTNYLPILLRP